jgi:hypothetical protein
MRVEFKQGVPEGCVDWLNEHVGKGNILVPGVDRPMAWKEDRPYYDWFYERISIPVPLGDAEPYNVPTITVKDDKLATLFILRWL